jgi:hypothetical protein
MTPTPYSLLYLRKSFSRKTTKDRAFLIQTQCSGSPGKQSCRDVGTHLEQGQQERQDYLCQFGKME